MEKKLDLSIPTLGEPTIPSPLNLSTQAGDGIADFTRDDERVVYDPRCRGSELFFQSAGPRQMNFFRGVDVVAGVVTCGGLCPGMNNVIRGLVMRLYYAFGVRRIWGFRYGFRGMAPNSPDTPMSLTPESVKDIHLLGGTILGSSRGPQDERGMVDTLQRMGVNALFVIGGDGSMHGLSKIYQEVTKRGVPISVIGVPKTIDNDLLYIERTFGFDTAVAIASEAIKAAHVEATGSPNGVGLVNLMGRHSGFIAASATLASREVNLVLVPEQPFSIEGEKGILSFLRQRVRDRGHAVVVVAEGAGQNLLPQNGDRDASGNVKLAGIGLFLRDTLKQGLKSEGVSLKYIDPSYIIRAAPANAGDSIFCGRLAEDAVHAAMAGKTGMAVGLWLNRLTHVPLSAINSGRNIISLDGSFWRAAIDTTGQPSVLCQ